MECAEETSVCLRVLSLFVHVQLSQTWFGWQWEQLTIGWEFLSLCTDFIHTLLSDSQYIHIVIHGQGLAWVRLDSWSLIQRTEIKVGACLLQYDSEAKHVRKWFIRVLPPPSVPCSQFPPEWHVFFRWSIEVFYLVFFSLLLSRILGSNTHNILFYLFHKSRFFLWVWNHVLNFYMFHN